MRHRPAPRRRNRAAPRAARTAAGGPSPESSAPAVTGRSISPPQRPACSSANTRASPSAMQPARACSVLRAACSVLRAAGAPPTAAAPRVITQSVVSGAATVACIAASSDCGLRLLLLSAHGSNPGRTGRDRDDDARVGAGDSRRASCRDSVHSVAMPRARSGSSQAARNSPSSPTTIHSRRRIAESRAAVDGCSRHSTRKRSGCGFGDRRDGPRLRDGRRRARVNAIRRRQPPRQ